MFDMVLNTPLMTGSKRSWKTIWCLTGLWIRLWRRALSCHGKLSSVDGKKLTKSFLRPLNYLLTIFLYWCLKGWVYYEGVFFTVFSDLLQSVEYKLLTIIFFSEAYLEPCKTSEDEAPRENNGRLKRQLHLRCLNVFSIRLCFLYNNLGLNIYYIFIYIYVLSRIDRS